MCGKLEQTRNICVASTCSWRNLGSASHTVIKSHMTRRRDILRPWTWCVETAVQSPWHPARVRELILTRSGIARTQTAERSGTIAQCSSVSRSRQAREDREVSGPGDTEASHLATKCSARSCCWPHPMSVFGKMGGGDTGTVCVILETRLFQN